MNTLVPVPTTPAIVTYSYGGTPLVACTALKHVRLVPVTHAAVEQRPEPTYTVGLMSTTPKLRPLMVTLIVEVEPMLYVTSFPETTGASNENVLVPVPTTAFTVTGTYASYDVTAALAQRTLVDVTQEEVVQAAFAIWPLGVESVVAKFRPLIETLTAALAMWLRRCSAETTGASNENITLPVPTTVFTVTTEKLGADMPDVKHTMAVLVVHDVVEQAPEFTVALGVKSVRSKFRPVTVREVMALCPRFWALKFDTTGAS